MRIRIRLLCLFTATLAAAPVVWAVPAQAAGPVIHAHGGHEGSDGGGDDDARDEAGAPRPVATNAGGAPAASGGAAGAAPPAPGPAAVSIVDGGFRPAAISVAAGSPVTWTNTDSSRHTATADGGAFDSGTLASGATFSFTFPTPGTYAYVCAFHSGMQGTVTVGTAGASAAPNSARVSAPASSSSAAPPTTGAVPTTAAGGSAPTAGRATVEARDYEFTPSRLTVGRGAEVTWRNTGQAPHTATGDGFDSGELAASETYVKRFDAPGTFEYSCQLHPRMQGVIEVVADATAAPVAAEVKKFPLERVAAGGIVGAPILLFVGAVFFWGRR